LEPEGGSFSLSALGTTITTLDQLRIALDALDGTAGNVTLSDNGSVQRLDVRIDTTLTGGGDLTAELLGSLADLDAQATSTADAHVHLVVGVDSQGFSLDANGNPAPEITIDHITAEVQGEARLGFIDTNLDEGILTLDPDVKLLINLHDPGTGAA